MVAHSHIPFKCKFPRWDTVHVAHWITFLCKFGEDTFIHGKMGGNFASFWAWTSTNWFFLAFLTRIWLFTVSLALVKVPSRQTKRFCPSTAAPSRIRSVFHPSLGPNWLPASLKQKVDLQQCRNRLQNRFQATRTPQQTLVQKKPAQGNDLPHPP